MSGARPDSGSSVTAEFAGGRLPADAGDGLCTARLRLRRYTTDDLPALIALNADAEVMAHLGGPMTAEATGQMLEHRILRYYDQHPGLGVWAACLRSPHQDPEVCVGMYVLNHVQGESMIQVGYRLARVHWGCGYATEMSRALLHYGYARLQLPLIMANTDLANIASQQVLLKVGLQRRGERAYPHPAYVAFGALAYFERSADAWLAEFASRGSAPTGSFE